MPLINQEWVDLYILDNWLPDGTGIDLCQHIRTVRPNTPIVFYSGVVAQAERDEAIRAGAHAYLIKPTGIQTLEWVVSALLNSAVAA
jgi:DNA-binding response OmpR family regulator